MAPRGTASESDDKPAFEIIDGQRVYLPLKTVLASVLTGDLFGEIYPFVEDIGFGIINCLFRLPIVQDRCRRPSIAFVPYSRWPNDRPIPNREDGFPVAPELVAEVVGAYDLASYLEEKTHEFLRAGANLVWQVYPKTQTVHVYDSPTSSRVLTRHDVLDGGSVLPQFKLPLTELFPPPANA